MTGEAIVLTQRAQQQLLVLNALERGELLMAQAADLLGRSVRQVRRVRAAYRQRGAQALVHGNRGRPSPRRIADATRDRVIALARTTYAAVNHKHLTELLAEREGIVLSHPTIHRLLREAGLRSPRRRRPPKHRRRRERMPQPGLLVQLDGSAHDWLEERGPRLVLLAALDDATGAVLAAAFRDHEASQPEGAGSDQGTLEVSMALATVGLKRFLRAAICAGASGVLIGCAPLRTGRRA